MEITMSRSYMKIFCWKLILASLVSLSTYADVSKLEIDGKTIHEARGILLNNGWKPVPFIGEPDEYGSQKDFIELGYVEVESCGGAGNFCLFHYTDSVGNKLKVVSAGEEGTNADGSKYYAIVDNYALDAAQPNIATVKQPSNSLATRPSLEVQIIKDSNYSVLRESPEYVKCIKKSILLIPKCAAIEKTAKENQLSSELTSIIASYQSSIPNIREQLDRSQSKWNELTSAACFSNETSQTDLCFAKMSDLRASYLSLFNFLDGDISVLLKDMDDYEKSNSIAEAFVVSFVPKVELDIIKLDADRFASDRIVNPATSQELLFNAMANIDLNDPERERLLEASSARGNFYASIELFKSYVTSGEIEKINLASEIVSNLAKNGVITFLHSPFLDKAVSAMKVAAKERGPEFYRSIMRAAMSEGSQVQMYTAAIESNFVGGATCEKLAVMMYDYADSDLADNIKKLTIDELISGADKAGCLAY